MIYTFPLGFLPSFYKLDLSEITVLLGGFVLDPKAVLVIEMLKIAVKILLKGTSTLIGDLANYIMGVSLCFTASAIYHRKKNNRSLIIGLVAGTVVLAVAGALVNYFILLPAYAAVFKMPLETIIAIGSTLNSRITSLATFIIFATVPFNLIKGAVSSMLAYIVYKSCRFIFEKK